MPELDLHNYQPQHPAAEPVLDVLTAECEVYDTFSALLRAITDPFERCDVGQLTKLVPTERTDFLNEMLREYYSHDSLDNAPFVRFSTTIIPFVRAVYEEHAIGEPTNDDVNERIADALCSSHDDARKDLAEIEAAFVARCWEVLNGLITHEDPPSPPEWAESLEECFTEDGPGKRGPPPAYSTFLGFLLAYTDCVLRAYDAVQRQRQRLDAAQ